MTITLILISRILEFSKNLEFEIFGNQEQCTLIPDAHVQFCLFFGFQMRNRLAARAWPLGDTCAPT